PQRGVVVGIGNIEDQPLAGAEEVDVEHGGQLRGRQVGGVGEEAARKHLESQMPSGLGEVDALQERLGIDVIDAVIDVRQRHGGKWGSGTRVNAGEVCEAKSRAAQCEYQCI